MKRFKAWHTEKWGTSAGTPSVPHRLLSSTHLPLLKCGHKISFCPTTVVRLLHSHRSKVLPVRVVSFHVHVKKKKFQVTHQIWIPAEAQVLRNKFIFLQCPDASQVQQVLSSYGGTWSGSCHRTGRGRSGRARPVLVLLHLAGSLDPEDPRLRQTSASFLEWEEG